MSVTPVLIALFNLTCRMCSIPDVAKVGPQRPLPRLRGRDRERAFIKIGACLPSPHPSPASGRGSRLSSPSKRRSAISLRLDAGIPEELGVPFRVVLADH